MCCIKKPENSIYIVIMPLLNQSFLLTKYLLATAQSRSTRVDHQN